MWPLIPGSTRSAPILALTSCFAAFTVPRDNRSVAWKIEKQANGKFAIYSTRIDDYIVIDADAQQIEDIYADKGVKVYLASARSQLAKETPVSATGEAKIAASRAKGSTPKEGEVPIGVTGFSLGEIEE